MMAMNDAMRPYHYWKFRAAVETLAAGNGPPKTRIRWALTNMAGLLEHELPEPVRGTYQELMVQVSWKQDGDPSRGYWEETLDAMSDEDARRVADLFVLLLEQSLDPSVSRGD